MVLEDESRVPRFPNSLQKIQVRIGEIQYYEVAGLAEVHFHIRAALDNKA